MDDGDVLHGAAGPPRRARAHLRSAPSASCGARANRSISAPRAGEITTGEIGHFNKGAFHLATALHAPIVPLYFEIPRDVDPGRGFDVKPGTVTVHVLPTVDTRDWVLDDLERNTAAVRAIFVAHNLAHNRAIHG